MERRKFAYSVVYPSYSVNKQEEKSLLHVHLERLSKKKEKIEASKKDSIMLLIRTFWRVNQAIKKFFAANSTLVSYINKEHPHLPTALAITLERVFRASLWKKGTKKNPSKWALCIHNRKIKAFCYQHLNMYSNNKAT